MRRALLCAVGIALIVVVGPSEGVVKAQSSAGLPATAGGDVARLRCQTCHDADLIESQRLSQAGWDREIAKMERWGAKLEGDERSVLVSYLARKFGQRPASTEGAAVVASGEATFKAACLSCHGEDLPAQQRLTAAGWGREVDKMVRWGARVSAGDKPALVDYLASRWLD